jgi:hypothetical protein
MEGNNLFNIKNYNILCVTKKDKIELRAFGIFTISTIELPKNNIIENIQLSYDLKLLSIVIKSLNNEEEEEEEKTKILLINTSPLYEKKEEIRNISEEYIEITSLINKLYKTLKYIKEIDENLFKNNLLKKFKILKKIYSDDHGFFLIF